MLKARLAIELEKSTNKAKEIKDAANADVKKRISEGLVKKRLAVFNGTSFIRACETRHLW